MSDVLFYLYAFTTFFFNYLLIFIYYFIVFFLLVYKTVVHCGRLNKKRDMHFYIVIIFMKSRDTYSTGLHRKSIPIAKPSPLLTPSCGSVVVWSVVVL